MHRVVFPVVVVLLLLAASPASAQQTQRGTLRVTVADNFAEEESVTSYRLETDEGPVPLLPTAPSPAASGDRVSVTGRMQAGHLVGSIQETASAPDVVEQGALTVAVVRIEFGVEENETPSDSELRKAVYTAPDSTNVYYQTLSHGRIPSTGIASQEGDVFGPYAVTADPEGECDYTTWAHAADVAAAAEGVSLAEYDHVIYVLGSHPPRICNVWVGLGEVPGRKIYMNSSFGVSKWVLAHELGHNFGLLHAGGMVCKDGDHYVQPGGIASCHTDEYGDQFDVMGIGCGYCRIHGWYLNRLDWLFPSNVQTIDSSGTYVVHADIHPTTETTVLRVPSMRNLDGEALGWYDLEIWKGNGPFEPYDRPLWGFPSYGVTIRTSPVRFEPSVLIYASDEIDEYNTHWQLMAGHTFNFGRLSITALEAGYGEATVTVTLKPMPDLEAPSVPGVPVASLGSSGVQLEWGESTDNVGVAEYLIYRDGEEIGTSPGNAFADSSVPASGPHAYTVYAVDAAGNRSDASGATVVEVTDTMPPEAPAGLAAKVLSAGVWLRWEPSVDASEYLLYRDGVEIGASGFLGFLDATMAPGSHSYAVYAVDAAGNRSARSAEVLVGAVLTRNRPAGVEGSSRGCGSPLPVLPLPASPPDVEIGGGGDIFGSTAGGAGPDGAPPGVPGAFRSSVLATGIWLEWEPAQDDVGIRDYRLVRDGTEIGATSQVGFFDSAATPGQHSYTVFAEDAAGHRGNPSTEVTVRMAATEPRRAVAEPGGGAASPCPSAPRPTTLHLSWRRNRSGAVVIRVHAGVGSQVVRLELSVDGKRRATSHGPDLRYVLSPAASGRVHRLVVRALGAGGETTTLKRVLRPRHVRIRHG